jgi:phage shock protein PspC (stress-responsive transcriptional regulator)
MKKLFKSKENKKIFGVCGGFAEYFECDPTVIRLITILFALCCGSGILAYLICAIVMPEKNIKED